MTSIQSGFANLEAHQRPIVGDLKMSVVNVDHIGWLICDGRSVSVSDFLFLFNVIGHSFGGSGSNFNLPNPAGRILGVLGQGTDSNPTLNTATFALGSNYGEYNHLLTIAEIPSHNHNVVYAASNTWAVGSSNLTGIAGLHTHTINDPGHFHQYSTPDGNTLVTPVSGGAANDDRTTLNTTSNTTGITVNSNGDHQHTIWAEGGSEYHNNIQPTIGLGNMFIYSGLPTYPTIFKQSYNGWPGFYQGTTPGVYLPNPPLQ